MNNIRHFLYFTLFQLISRIACIKNSKAQNMKVDLFPISSSSHTKSHHRREISENKSSNYSDIECLNPSNCIIQLKTLESRLEERGGCNKIKWRKIYNSRRKFFIMITMTNLQTNWGDKFVYKNIEFKKVQA